MSITLETSSDPSLVPDGVARGLKSAAVVTVVTGLFFAIASTAPTDGLVRQLLDLVFFRLGDGPAELGDSHHLVNAILGGVMAGWGVMIWLLVDKLLPVAPREVKRILLAGLVTWFVIDSAGSIASSGWPNAVLNVAFLGMFLIPFRKLP